MGNGEIGVQTPIIEQKQIKEYDYRCSACGGDRECDCSAPAVPKTQRAIEAIKADPDRSDRAIAKDIGVSQPTVSKARKEVEATDKQLSVEARIGLDGKTREVPEKKAATAPEPAPMVGDDATCQLDELCRIVSFAHAAGRDDRCPRIIKRRA